MSERSSEPQSLGGPWGPGGLRDAGASFWLPNLDTKPRPSGVSLQMKTDIWGKNFHLKSAFWMPSNGEAEFLLCSLIKRS